MDTSIVTLQFSEPTNQVKAIVHFPEDVTSNTFQVDDQWIQQALKDNSFEQYYILAEGVVALKAAVQAKQSTMIAIAERRDAEINIIVEDYNMHAYLQIKLPFGGKQATVENVKKLMESMKIKFGINDESITQAVQQGECQHVLIASGKEPIDGKDAYFEVLVEEDKHFGPTINEHGVANFLEVNELSMVNQGDHLMRKIPRTLGENGSDVFGNAKHPVPGRNIQFAEELNGAEINKDDENLLIAAIKGHPIVEKCSVRVDPTYVLDRVDLSTGNINFDGSVLVKGDVENNMKVVATGDITINGCVIKALIEAGGRVIINQGIIGGESIKTKEGIVQRGSHVKSGGILTAGFIDNVVVSAQSNILVKDYIANSEVMAGGDLIVGSAGYKGYIVGGNVQALHIISANVLGSNAQMATKVKVGFSLELARAYERKVEKLQEYEATLNALSKAFIEIGKREAQGPLTTKSKQVLANLINTLKAVAPTIHTLGDETGTLRSQIGENKTAKVIVRERVFSGVELNLCEKIYTINRDMVGGVFEFKGGTEITISPLGNKAK